MPGCSAPLSAFAKRLRNGQSRRRSQGCPVGQAGDFPDTLNIQIRQPRQRDKKTGHRAVVQQFGKGCQILADSVVVHMLRFDEAAQREDFQRLVRVVLKDRALRVVALAASAVALATLQKLSSRYC